MITLNKLAPKILKIIERRFHLNDNTSKKAFSLKISAAWRKFDELSELPCDDIKDHPEYKKRAADTVSYTHLEEDLFKYVINLNKNGVKMAKFLFAKLVIL